jgi:hypothetical protein
MASEVRHGVMQPRRWISIFALGLIAIAVVLAHFGVPRAVIAAILVITLPLIWLSSRQDNLAAYLATLSVQIPQSFGPFRSAVSDLFMLPVLAHTAMRIRQRKERLTYSTLTIPFAVMGAAFAIATVIAIVNTGGLSGYVLVNRLAGLLYLVAGFYTLLILTRSFDDITMVARWFVIGVSAANVMALLVTLAAFAGFHNGVYAVDNLRLFGWVGNPNLFGGVLLTAAMIELGCLSFSSTIRLRKLRWANVWLMAVALVLTVSRGAWLASGVGAAGLWAVLMLARPLRPNLRPAYYGVLAVWGILPAIALAGILNANLVGGMGSLSDRVTELRARSKPQAEVAPAARQSLEHSLRAALEVRGSVMNARGLLDRGAILHLGWSVYAASTQSMLLGIGLGTFFSISAAHMGFPLIIHNTFAWFLIELGPIGLTAILLIWGRTAHNLWVACNAGDERRELAVGLFGAFAAMTIFWLVNEGFYQRHYWLIFALADRLRLLPAGTASVMVSRTA